MILANFRSNIPSRSGEQVDFIVLAIFSTGSHPAFSTTLNFLIQNPVV